MGNSHHQSHRRRGETVSTMYTRGGYYYLQKEYSHTSGNGRQLSPITQEEEGDSYRQSRGRWRTVITSHVERERGTVITRQAEGQGEQEGEGSSHHHSKKRREKLSPSIGEGSSRHKSKRRREKSSPLPGEGSSHHHSKRKGKKIITTHRRRNQSSPVKKERKVITTPSGRNQSSPTTHEQKVGKHSSPIPQDGPKNIFIHLQNQRAKRETSVVVFEREFIGLPHELKEAIRRRGKTR